jgi:phenylpropionate dioxygenase-like ring-hydroxylating dioxygenase large terminal subunit
MAVPMEVASLVEQLRARIGGAPVEGEPGEVPVEHYLSAAHHELERARVFARVPQIVALEAEVAEPGACVAVEVAGVSIAIVRGNDGVVRGLKNACRHRATRLVGEERCRKKAFVCPYHGWTYDLAGELIHVPDRATFDGREAGRTALAPVHVEARHGFVWGALEPFDLSELLGPVEPDLAALEVGRSHLYRSVTHEVRGNWKLVIDAFLEAYHIRHLHRDSIHRFFIDSCAVAERAGRHIRAVTARRALRDRASIGGADLRELATPSYHLFPTAILILHPDYLSVVRAVPVAPDRCRLHHAMLVPVAPRSAAEAEHWARSFELIDEGVFVREDLRIVEAMQHGLETGANRTLLFGRHEHAALWFHAELARAMG